ncbi:MAG: serine hydrolase domain-containing protein [Armatimonadota bacterium]
MSETQHAMQQFLNTLVQDKQERGVQLAVYLDGELIVDAWAGNADAATGRPVDGETLFPVFSVTKGITATVLHLMVEQGKLSYDTRVAEVWPEFAVHGKDDIRVRHVLSHTAGLWFLPQGIGYAELVDWETMCIAVAQLTPATPPGVEMYYHAITYGWLVGEIVRRVDGRPFPQVLQEEVCRPLGITSLFMGIPDEVEPRVAILDEVFDPALTIPDDTTPQNVPGWLQPLSVMMNRPDARRACLPGANGIMSARAIARHYAALLPGGVDGVELLPPERIWQATRLTKLENNPQAELPMNFGLGYLLYDDLAGGDSRPTFGHNGHGGAFGLADPKQRLAVGFAKSRIMPYEVMGTVLAKLRQVLEIE